MVLDMLNLQKNGEKQNVKKKKLYILQEFKKKKKMQLLKDILLSKEQVLRIEKLEFLQAYKQHKLNLQQQEKLKI